MMDREEHEGKNLEQKQRKRLKASDEQLLKELEEAEKSIKDTDFPGVEERLFRRLMERKAAEEAAAKKKAQIRRRRRVMVVALVAVFMMALGFTAVGEKSYFFRYREKEEGVVFNNDQNKVAVGSLTEAYLAIEENFGVKVPRLGYQPDGFKFETLDMSSDIAILTFEYKGNKIHFLQEYRDIQVSRGANSDRKNTSTVYNKWLKTDIIVEWNELNSEETEYGARMSMGRYIYRLTGIMDEEEFKNIIENIYFLN